MRAISELLGRRTQEPTRPVTNKAEEESDAALGFYFPKNFFNALKVFAEITGIEEDKDRYAHLLQDALHIYERTLVAETDGKTVLALNDEALDLLRENGMMPEEGDIFPKQILPDKVDKARKFFYEPVEPSA